METPEEPDRTLPVRLHIVDDSVVAMTPVHAAVGALVLLSGAALSVAKGIGTVAAPIQRAVLYPPILPERLQPIRAVEALALRGRSTLAATGADLERLIAAIVPVVVAEVLDTLDLNAIVSERVDIDGLIATVDLDAVVDRIDIGAIVERLDINAIAEGIDLNRIIARVDIDKIVAGVDLTAVIDRINVVGIAEDVITEIDLPEIIRDSTGSMASQVVRDARMQSVDADEAISRLVDRLLRRRRARRTAAPVDLSDHTSDPVDEEVPS